MSETISLQEVAQISGIKIRDVYSYRSRAKKNPKIMPAPVEEAGKSPRWLKADIENWVEERNSKKNKK